MPTGMNNQPSSSSQASSSDSFDQHNTRLQATALKATRNAATLPADINFYRSIDSALAQDIDTVSSRVLNLTNKLLEFSSSINPQIVKGKGKAKLRTQDDVVDNFHSLVVDVMDQLFERTDTCLDQALGRNKAPVIAINPPTTAAMTGQKRKATAPKGHLDPAIHHASHLTKPQLTFKRKVDNSDTPWYPSLSHKYNAKVPLGHVLIDPDEENDAEDSSTAVANHPYRYEIQHIIYPPHIYSPTTPTPPVTLADTPFNWVSTIEALQTMLGVLRSAREIAVDLEHHSYRSYVGFLCLMQISTREQDWVVDVIALRDEMEILNEVFTNPNIVKVFHGAESDIVWLQQDFNLYVVNLFDTFHASKLLEFPRHGLANLLEMYCDYVPDKRYQLADWRIRPLPEEMLEYARSDTHFLLFIYDNLRNALLDRALSRSQSCSRSSSPPSHKAVPSTTSPALTSTSSDPAHALIDQVLSRSAETSLRVYTKEPYDHSTGRGSTGWDTLARKWNKIQITASASDSGILGMQKAVYRAVHWWREKVAREEDESTRYILPNHILFQIAEQPPGDLAALLRIFRNSIPGVIKNKAKELLEVAREAVKTSLGESAVEGATQVKEKEVDGDVRMTEKEDGDTSQPSQNQEKPVDKLWGTNGTDTVPKTSSLFGTTQPTSTMARAMSESSTSTYATSQSVLFGHNARTSKPVSSVTSHPPSRLVPFQELVARINSTLVIVPTVPKVNPAPGAAQALIEDPEANASTAALEEATGMQVEIPFAPAAQRQTSALKVEEKMRDTIVVVGQPKQKKRKRAKMAKGDDGGQTSTQNAEQKAVEDEEAFDFSNVPNILDDNPDMEHRRTLPKKQRKKAKGAQFHGDFPAPPKAHSEFKGGNQSHTFK